MTLSYKERWARDRGHDSYHAYFIQRLNDQKLAAIVAAGGKCVDCGFDDLSRPEVFDFDHRDPRQKHPELRKRVKLAITRLPKALRAAELAKCDLVCANCHRTRSNPH